MSAAINDGGPAYPVNGRMYGDQLGGQLSHGMTLRDYFAGQALAGLCAARGASGKYDNLESEDSTATLAYQLAAEMLAARKASQ